MLLPSGNFLAKGPDSARLAVHQMDDKRVAARSISSVSEKDSDRFPMPRQPHFARVFSSYFTAVANDTAYPFQELIDDADIADSELNASHPKILRTHVSLTCHGGSTLKAIVPARNVRSWSLTQDQVATGHIDRLTGKRLPPPRKECDCHWVLDSVVS